MPKRDPLITILLMSFTCGLYALYYTYITTKDLTAALAETSINLGLETILNLASCGLFGVYLEYRNQQLIDRWYEQQGIEHEAKANQVGLMNLAGFLVGVTWFVAVYIHVEELNKLAAILPPRSVERGAPQTF